jgi:exopolysaccharide production protein ExoZ
MVSNIQVLRAFAALAVVWRHMTMWFEPDLGYGLVHAGRAGVDVFFVISGFIMFHTTQDHSRSTLEFWKDRVIRIVPLYWLMIALTVGLFLLRLPADEVKAFDAGDLAANLFFIPNIRADGDWNPIVNAGWTLTYEMYFYAVFGLTFLIRSQAKALALIIAFFVGIWFVSMATDIGFVFFRWAQPISLEFAAGGCLALLFRARIAPSKTLAIASGILLIAGGIVAILINGWIFGDATAEPTPLRALLYGPPAVAIVAAGLLMEKAGVVWNSRTLLFLGAASYSIYLVHSVTLQYTSLIWRDWFGASPVAMPAFALAGMIAAVLVGSAVYIAIERPMHRWLKARMSRRRPVLPAAA